MYPENARRLRFIVARGGQDLFDVVIFQSSQAQELITGRRDVIFGEGLSRPLFGVLVANLFGKVRGIDLALLIEDHGSFDYITQFANVAGPGIVCKQIGGCWTEAGEVFS